MALNEIQQGINAVRSGDLERGDALLRYGLNDPSVTGSVRAVALMWLAETNPSVQFKIQCYQAALNADPTNIDIQNRLRALQTAPPPPPPSPEDSKPITPILGEADKIDTQDIPRMWEFGVEGGPNGIGTGFLVVRDGLVATSRFIISNLTEITLLTRGGRQIPAKVVRSYPEYDLAFVKMMIRLPFLRDMSPTTTVAPKTTLIADDYTEQEARAECIVPSKKLPEGWFATNFPHSLPRSFIGAPIIDDKEDIVGMLTRNAYRSQSPDVPDQLYGLHVSMIRRKFEAYYTELQHDPDRMYCGTCGNRSKAGAEGLYYCEFCGAVLPFARKVYRTPHPRASEFYLEKQKTEEDNN